MRSKVPRTHKKTWRGSCKGGCTAKSTCVRCATWEPIWDCVAVSKAYPLRPPPTGDDYTLSADIVHHLRSIPSHSSWLSLVPSRVGYSYAVDHASIAVNCAIDFNAGAKRDQAKRRAAMENYGLAIQRLRHDLNISAGRTVLDDYLICAALLVVFEILIKDTSEGRQKDTFAHWSGLSAILQASPAECETSEATRAILYSFWDCTFGVPVALGLPSPFDNERWLDTEPLRDKLDGRETLQLKKITNQLLIRLPRLICYTRRFREDCCGDTAEEEMALESARLMSEMRNATAESAILHRAKVNQSSNEDCRGVVPFSLAFDNVESLKAGLLYWFARMMTINCCLKMVEVAPDAAECMDPVPLEEEKSRAYTNVMMCWEQAQRTGPFATMWVAKGLLHNWTFLRQHDTWRGMDSSEILEWVYPRLQHPYIAWYTSASSMHDFDLAADLLVGGPLQGFIASAKNRTAIS